MINKCIICNNKRFIKYLDILIKCSKCNLVLYDQNKIKNIKELYKQDYFNGSEYYSYQDDKNIIQLNFKKNLKIIRSFSKSGSLLEIGCAYGYFLELAKKYYNVLGIDIAPEATKFARNNLKLKVRTNSYLNEIITNKLDIVCLWDTIEHLEFPEKFIKKIYQDLNNNGYLFLTTGDIDSLLARIQAGKWRMIHPPTHLFYFSKDTITKLLEKHGFEIVSITYPGIFRNLRQILYSLFIINKKNKGKLILSIINKINLPIYVNTFDIMFVVARKKV